jgi:superoxide oxidase
MIMNYLKYMSLSRPRIRYILSLRVIHWLTVAAIAAAFLLADMGEDGENGKTATSGVHAMQWHYVAGLVVLLLVVPRLLSRIYALTPPIVPTPGALTATTARIMHLALYLFLIAQPLLGWLQLSYGGEQIILPRLGWHLPALVHPDAQSKEIAGEVHELFGNILYGLIGLHVFAALWHHFVRRDNTLKRML